MSVVTHEPQMLVNDPLCESKVLGTILNYGSLFDREAELLTDDCFHDGKLLGLWQAMCEVRRRGKEVDVITVTAELAREGSTIQPWEVVDISQNGHVSSDIDDYVLRLKDLSLRRRLWRLGQKLVAAGVAETDEIADVQQLATEELNGLFDKAEGTFTLTEALLKLSDIIYRNITKGTATTGTRTGFRKLDEKGGLQGSDLIIVAGETSNGKTALSLSIVKNVIESGEKCCFYSMEMTKEQLAARLLAMKTGIPANSIMYNGELNPNELEQIDSAKAVLPGDNLFFDERSTSSLETILLSIRNMKLKYGIKGAVVDYLQILNVNQKNSSYTREQAMGDASRRLKNLAKELGIWIMALSQLSRNQQDPVPSLSRLRDSGQIAEAADVVMLIYRPELYHKTFPEPFNSLAEDECRGKAMIDVAKGRNIGVFKFLVEFTASTTHFTDLSLDEYSPPDEPVEEEAPF